MTRMIAVDIEGLNLILGGGIPVLKRHETFGESATLLVRGPPGSGKSVLGWQIAGSLARSLGCDVAYGCVELLPSELAAQHAGIKRPEVKERVVTAPFEKPEPKGDDCRLFAEMLDIGASGEEVAKLGDAIEHVLEAIERAGGQPGVLVLDSLSDGYNLGAKAPRELADAVCKMAAQRGMVLILLEETVETRPSPWSFACDTVLELDVGPTPVPHDAGEVLCRRIRVPKNRLGASEPGPHVFEIVGGAGVKVYPSVLTYLRPAALSTLLPKWTPPPDSAWSWGSVGGLELQPSNRTQQVYQVFPPFNACATLVHGDARADVLAVASNMGAAKPPSPVRPDIILRFEVGSGDLPVLPLPGGEAFVVTLSTSSEADQIVSSSLNALSHIWKTQQRIGRVFIGDLRITHDWSPEKMRSVLGTLLSFLRSAYIPAILVDTEEMDSAARWAHFRAADVAFRALLAPPNPIQVKLLRAGIKTISASPALISPGPLNDALMKYL